MLNTTSPKKITTKIYSLAHQFFILLLINIAFIAVLFFVVYLPFAQSDVYTIEVVKSILWQSFFLLIIATSILVWLIILADSNKRKAYEALQKQRELLAQEIDAHKQTTLDLKSTKEAATTANQAKTLYLSGVSHELRTPLNTIFGYSQILEMDSQIPEKSRQAAAAIRRNSEHLTDVINDLLEISKIEARHLDIHRDQVRITSLIDQLVDMFRIQAQAKKIDFIYKANNALPEFVLVDETRLRQILINLLANAIKFTSKGSVSFHVSYRNEVAKFSVSDTGVGIKAEDQERIFEPFERLRHEDTQRVTVIGTGLGLSISRLLCNLMGGDISLTSQYGVGTRFEFQLLMPKVYNPTIQPVEKRQIVGYKKASKTILVIDDEPSHRDLMIDLLSPLGFNVIPAQNAKIGIHIASEKKIDLFLLDASMPATDGRTLAKQFKRTHKQTPIGMLSANAIEANQLDSSDQPYDFHLTKPIQLNALLEKIGVALKLNSLYHEPNTIPPNIYPLLGSLPSKNELDELVSMAQIGYLKGITDKLEQMTRADKNSSFIKYLVSRAELCDLESIIHTIKGLGKS